jgi:iron complex outermembrane recepter protein
MVFNIGDWLRGQMTFGCVESASAQSYFTTDVVYRLDLPSDLAITRAVFNVADRDPPAVRLTDYNYDPSFGNPIGRVFKLGLSKQFR